MPERIHASMAGKLVDCMVKELVGDDDLDDLNVNIVLTATGMAMGIVIGIKLMGLSPHYAQTLADVLVVEYESETGARTGSDEAAKRVLRDIKLDLTGESNE